MPRQRKHPVTNQALAVLLKETGWSMGTAAKMINETAERSGRRLQYRAPSVNHWLIGVQPNLEAIPVIVETFADALNRPGLSAEDLGWPDVAVGVQSHPWLEHPFICLSNIAWHDLLHPQGSHSAEVYSATYLSPKWLPQCLRSPDSGPPPRCDLSGDAARISEGTEVLRGALSAFGGGYSHTLGSCFLVNNTLPVLGNATGATRQDILGATLELTCLLGSMCEDAGAQARAQQYYILALRFAAEAADPTALFIACTQLAAQASWAGHARAARDLLNAAESMYRPPRYNICLGRAIAHAYLGEATEARADLAEAEQELSRVGFPSPCHWVSVLSPSTLEGATGLVLMALGDLRGAICLLTTTLTTHQPEDRLGRALTGVRLARLQVAARDTDDAARTVQLVAGDLPAVTSARLMAEVAALREAWPTAGPVPPSAITTSHAKHERALINPAGAEAARIGLAVG